MASKKSITFIQCIICDFWNTTVQPSANHTSITVILLLLLLCFTFIPRWSDFMMSLWVPLELGHTLKVNFMRASSKLSFCVSFPRLPLADWQRWQPHPWIKSTEAVRVRMLIITCHLDALDTSSTRDNEDELTRAENWEERQLPSEVKCLFLKYSKLLIR